MTESPDPSLPALAAQVADLRGQLAAAVTVSGRDSVRLHEQVADLARTVAALEEQPSPSEPKVTAPVWTGDDDADAEQLTDLAEWVDGFLAENYPHAGVRPCWANHRAVVWELSTLRAEWDRTYERSSPELAGALAWHDRWLPGVITRIGVILQDCKSGCALARPRPQTRSQPRPG